MDSNKYVLTQFMPAAGGAPLVNINSVAIAADKINVTLAPDGLSGPFKPTKLSMVSPQFGGPSPRLSESRGKQGQTTNFLIVQVSFV